MFDRITRRAEAAAAERARVRARGLADRVRAELPRGIEADAVNGGLVLVGRALKRRFALNPMLRWLFARLK